jgi:hypothetical protein
MVKTPQTVMEVRLISRFERHKESLISSNKFLQDLKKNNSQ